MQQLLQLQVGSCCLQDCCQGAPVGEGLGQQLLQLTDSLLLLLLLLVVLLLLVLLVLLLLGP
jgi:hypothetical protein